MPVRDESGKVARWFGTNTDISEQRKTEDALRENQARLRLAQEVAQIGTFEWNLKTGVNRWTPELEAMYGLPPGGFGGTQKEWEELVHPDDRAETLRRLGKAMEQGGFEAEWRVIWPDGTVRWLSGRGQLFKDELGNPQRLVGANIDITEIKRVAEESWQKQRLLALALEAANLGAWHYQLDSGIVFWDERCREIYGVASGSQIGYQDGIAIYHPDDRAGVDEAVKQAISGADGGRYHRESRLIGPDGSEKWIASHGRAFFEGEGDQRRAVRFVGVSTDITERKRVELAVLRMNVDLEHRVQERTVELEAANNELAAFAYSVAHDLRAPLRGIDGWSLALLDDYGDQLDDGARKYLNRVRSETQRMGYLIDDILQLSRVTRGEMKLDPVDLTALAYRITGKLRDAQPERSMEFVIAPELVALGDGRLLEIALTNLFSNAVKFTGKRDKALIEFGRIEKEGEMAFYVRDNGAGFDMGHASTLFGAFQRMHKASEFPGTGIGLAIVQRVVGRRGGRVWAEAQVNCGATFWFTLGVAA
jgi:PAS domain S-box-containing protein